MGAKFHTLFAGLVLAVAAPCLLAQGAQSGPPLGAVEILGRLGLDESPSSLASFVVARVVSFAPSADFLERVKLAGGDGILVERLASAEPASNAIPLSGGDPPVAHLAKCVELIHVGGTEAGEKECHAAIEENPESAWPPRAAAHVLELRFSDIADPTTDKQNSTEWAELTQRSKALDPVTSVFGGRAETYWRNPFGLFSDDDESKEPPVEADEQITPQLDRDLRQEVEAFPDEAICHVRLAEAYAVHRNSAKAENELQEAIRLEPGNAALHIALATVYFVRHDRDATVAQLREAYRIAPFEDSQRSPYATLAQVLETLGRTSEAVSTLQGFIAERPTSFRASDALVKLYLKHKDRKSAIEELRRLLQAGAVVITDQAILVEVCSTEIEQLAELLRENHELDAAAEQYASLMRFRPDAAEYHYDLGNVLFAQHRTDEAIAQYKEALRLEQATDQDDLNERAIARQEEALRLEKAVKKNNDDLKAEAIANYELMRRGAADEDDQKDEAIKQYSAYYIAQYKESLRLAESANEQPEVSRYNSEISMVHRSIGMCLAAKKDLDGAIYEYRQALERLPEDGGNQIILGGALGLKGDRSGAMELFRKAIDQNPKDAETHAEVGYALDQMKDSAGAIGELKTALELEPKSEGALNGLAWIYATAADPKFRNPSEALTLAQRAVSVSERANAATLDTLAEALLVNGRSGEALATETEALKLDPEDPQMKARMVRFREAAGAATKQTALVKP
jgi:tetratricopeptide (TPR) repeat protein